MDIPAADLPVLRERLRKIFAWLREPPSQADDYDAITKAWMPLISRHWVDGLGEKRPRPLPGLGLGETHRIVLLTSLAPGADTIAADVAREVGIEVRCPLPFPPDLYRGASTFTSAKDPGAALADFDRFVHDGPDACDHFEVILEEERGLSESDRFALLTSDQKDRSRRHLRYRAAGEYVASHCDLLLALYTPDPEGEGATAGTGAIVRMRHEGPTHGLLPAANSFPWIESGPVFFLPTRSRKRMEAAGESEDDLSWCNQSALFLPPRWEDHCDLSDPPARPDDACVREGYERLLETARLFSRYEAAVKDMAEPESLPGEVKESADVALEKHLGLDDLKKDGLSPDGVAFLRGLAPIAKARSIASVIATRCDEARNRMMRRMAACAFFAALSFHGFSHWHFVHKGATCPEDSAAKGNSQHGVNHQLETLEAWFAFGFLAVTILLVGIAIWSYCRYLRSGQEWLRFDARALAEGLRVQFYWAAAGLHASVAARYMFRQKGELDWIRNAISSLSFPYHRWKDGFERLISEDRRLILRQVRQYWLGGQCRYFLEKGGPSCETRLHRFHTLGWALTFTGIFQPLLLLGYKIASKTDPCPFMNLTTAGLLTAGITSIIWSVARQKRLVADGLAPDHDSIHWKDTSPFLTFLDRCLGHGRLPVFLLTSGLIVILSHRAPEWMTILPGTKDLWIILTGAHLVGGAILIAWGEKLTLSEHLRQYEAMGHLFAHSTERADMLLSHAILPGEPLPTIDHEAVFQDLLMDLGKEALDENAEWLLLHRSRPFEPFLAG